MKYLRNPVSGICVMTRDAGYAARLRGYGWEMVTREVWSAWLRGQADRLSVRRAN